MGNDDKILLFDGVCNLCNGLVRFIIRRDKEARIKFASLQSDSGKALLSESGLESESIDTVIYISGGKPLIRSTAVLELLKDIGGGWRIFYGLKIIPQFIRDMFYNLLARKRYYLFGRKEKCMVPSKDIENRFL